MKTPNNHYLDLNGGSYRSKESVILIAGSLLRTCEGLFEAAVQQKATLSFEFDDTDFLYLQKLFPDIKEETKLVQEFLSGIINMRLKMPYDVSVVFRAIDSPIFRCRIVHELPLYD